MDMKKLTTAILAAALAAFSAAFALDGFTVGRLERKINERRITALVRLGKWDAFEAWLKGRTVDGLNAYTSFMLANELSDGHPMFNSLLEEAKAVLGVDDAAAEAILGQCGM